MFIFWKGKTMVDYRDDNAKYGNEEYFKHNQQLMFYERDMEIIGELENLDLN